MVRLKSHILIKALCFGVIMLYCATMAMAHASFDLKALRVEYTDMPLGIDVAQPRFSWQMVSPERGAAQSAYRITVKNENGKEVWNSGKVNDPSALNILYQGQSLQPSTRYLWTVTVWNNKGEQNSDTSWFETGLMCNSDKSPAWSGAKWIGGDDSDGLTFYSQYLPVFRLRFGITLDKRTHSTAAGFIYGANDIRLMNRNKNILNVENSRNASYVKVALDTHGLAIGDSASVEVYRIGYTVKDRADVPFAVFKIPTDLVNKTNQYSKHLFEISSMHGTTCIDVDGKEVVEVNLNPMGKGGDYISFPVVGDIGYSVAERQKATFSDIAILNFRLPRHALSTVSGAVTLSGKTQIFTPQETGAPMLRTAFQLWDKPIESARIYATSRGIYELYLNGKRIGDDFLDPGLTQYNKTQFYQTFDVTSQIENGANALGAVMNEGWWSGAISFSGENWNFFGDKQSLLAKLVVTYQDHTQQVIVTDPSTWQFYNNGPVRIGSLFQGEVYDATREAAVKDWSTVGYNASEWSRAKEVPLEGTISHEQIKNFLNWPCPDDYSHFTLTAQLGKPVRLNRMLTAKSVKEVRPGVYVYDMGQNMAGVPHIDFAGLQPGTKVMMRYAEMTYPDLPEYKDHVGMVMLENMRGAMDQDIYVAKGGNETFEPRYTYHGYRYVEITGIPSALPTTCVKGLVLSTVNQLSSEYETDNKELNRFFLNTQWSSLANIFSIPTDCPQRNERMGWSGDLSVFSPTMSYMFNGAEFLRRHLIALRDVQESDGAFTPIAPIGGGFGGPLWQSVGITMPWQSYLQYDDINALKEHYPSMCRYIDLVLNKYIDPEAYYYRGTGGMADLGDWLGFEVNKNDNSLIFDCYLTYELQIMSRIARVLGKPEDAERFEKERQIRINFINAHYIDPVTCKTVGTGFGEIKQSPLGPYGPKRKGVLIDTQTSYALPLAFGIVAEKYKQKFIENFLNTISRQSVGDDGKTYPQYSLMTGFIGTAWISMALSEVGHTDDAYKMLLNTHFPSWLYPVEQGATTIWERLNSYTKTDGFGGNNSMNSFNHYAFGSVTNWIMQRSLGISRDENAPGFKHFILRPEVDPTGSLNEAHGYYDSMYGRIESSWKKTGDRIVYQFVIPANTSATLYLPLTKINGVTVNGMKLKKAEGVTLKSARKDKLAMELVSGMYKIELKTSFLEKNY
ncbi:MAG: glycoside hydrolase family 78 protein [Prevotella sp.]|nr:alpha-L-rhamnosidase [Prevotella sp.]MCH3994929.1 glycoside hydrolase family 78 protein [Prevotella sp.]MCI1246168.1 glycoside hydrolase family 78 protein [Prevotella sp.]